MLSERRALLAVALVVVLLALTLGVRACRYAPSEPAAESTASPLVLLISIDGFRWDYLSLHDAPTLQQLAADGVWADQGMTAVFPTKCLQKAPDCPR